jgi:hypothetical protein
VSFRIIPYSALAATGVDVPLQVKSPGWCQRLQSPIKPAIECAAGRPILQRRAETGAGQMKIEETDQTGNFDKPGVSMKSKDYVCL